MPGGFTNTPTGGLILTAAQQIVANRRQQRALELREQQAEANMRLAERNLELRERNADVQQRFAETQARFAELKAAGEGTRQAQASADLRLTEEKILTEQADRARKPGAKPLTPTQLTSMSAKLEASALDIALIESAQARQIPLRATDTFASLETRLRQLLGREEELKDTLDPGAGASQEQIEEAQRDLQELSNIRSIVSDPELSALAQRIRMGDIPEEMHDRALKATTGAAALFTAQQSTATVRRLQAAAPAPVSFMPKADDATFKEAADQAVAGQPVLMTELVRTQALTSDEPLTPDTMKQFNARLEAAGYETEQRRKIISDVVRGLTD